MQSWSAPLGQPRDLDELVAVLLSLARTKHGIDRVSIYKFFDAIEKVAREYPQFFEGVDFQRSGDFVSSRSVGNALQGALTFGVDVCNPSFQFVTVTPGEAASIIKWSEHRSGKPFVRDLQQVAKSFAAKLHQPSPAAVRADAH